MHLIFIFTRTFQVSGRLFESLRRVWLCMTNMADKSRTKLKREKNKEKQEGRKRKRSENDDVEIAKHYETL